MAKRPVALSAQLRSPVLRSDVLPRERLMAFLRAAPGHRIVLISADAGHGKTTLLTQFQSGCGGTAIWYSLSERDTDLAVFYRRLIEAAGGHFRTARRSLERYVAEHPGLHRDPAGAATAFVDSLARAARRDYYLIFDDFHLLHDCPFVTPFFTTLVDLLPPHLHVVIASRQDPPLPLPLWRTRRQVLELRNADLRFQPREVEELYRDRLKLELSSRDARFLLDRTEGWAAGLRWIAERMRLGGSEGELDSILEGMTRGPDGLSEFYEAELFRRLPEREQAFLLRVASLESFGEDVAAIAWKTQDRPQVIRSLVRRNLLSPVGQGGSAEFRVHPLFREFLLDRAREALPAAERARLLEALGRKLLEKDASSGLEQWNLIPAHDRVAKWLSENGTEFLGEGRYSRLERLLAGLPRSTVEAEPRLRILRAENRRILGDARGALEDFHAVERLARGRKDTQLAADAALGAAKIYTARGDARRSLRIGEALLKLGKGLGPRLRARALQHVGGALFYLGRYRETEVVLAELREYFAAHPEEVELELAAEHNLALTYCAMGRFLEARELFERHLRRPEVRASRRRPLHLANLSLLQLECGETTRARETVIEAEAMLDRGGNLLQRASVLLSKGEVEVRLGNLAAAKDVCAELDRISPELSHRAIEVGSVLLRARFEAIAGTPARARELVAEGMRALGLERGSLWYDLRYLDGALWLAEGRWGRATAVLRPLAAEADKQGLLHIVARARLGLGAAERAQGNLAASRRETATALKLCAAQNYELYVTDAARHPDPFADAWLAGVESEWIAKVLSRKEFNFWEAVSRLMPRDKAPRKGLPAIAAEWGDEVGLGVLQAWSSRKGEGAREAAAARRSLERRLGVSASRVSSPIEARLLGPFELVVRGERLPLRAFRTERAAQLFAYLLVRGDAGESRERLLSLFWPSAPASEARRNLSPTLSYIREALRARLGEVEVLERDEGRVRITPAMSPQTDIARLRRFEAARGDEVERLAAARELIESVRGEFLDGWAMDWVLEERERISVKEREALRVLARADHAAGRPVEAERWLREALRRDPLDEAAVRDLLETLAQRGEYARAWSEHRALVDRLRRAGLPAPEPSTLQLVARLRAAQRECVN